MPAKVYKYDPVSGRMVYVRTTKVQPREHIRLEGECQVDMGKTMAQNVKDREGQQ
jgi:hypothetical protein